MSNKIFTILTAFIFLLCALALPIKYIGLDEILLSDLLFLILCTGWFLKKSSLTVKSGAALTVLVLTIYFLVTLLQQEIQIFSYLLYLKLIQLIIWWQLLGWFVYWYDAKITDINSFLIVCLPVAVALLIFLFFFRGGGARLGMPFVNNPSPAPAAFFIGSATIFLFGNLLSAGTMSKKILLGLLTVICWIGILLTSSRTGIIALLGGLSVMALMVATPRTKIFVLVFIVLAVVTVDFVLGFTRYASSGIIQFIYPENLLNEGAFIKRIEYAWFGNWTVLVEGPFSLLFGIGLGNHRFSDSLYFFILYNFGLLGIIIFSALVLGILSKYQKNAFIISFTAYFLIFGIASESPITNYRVLPVVILILHVVLKRDFLCFCSRRAAHFSNIMNK